jgi:hypothetical protein
VNLDREPKLPSPPEPLIAYHVCAMMFVEECC